MAVEKGADCLIDIPVDLVPTGLELCCDTFTLTDQLNYLMIICVH